MLEVRDIWKSYENKPLLNGVSFTLEAGETMCLLGASGSGKSTLLRIIAGLEKPERGQVLWDGRDLANVPVNQRNFGLMFQDYALFPHKSVAENVAFGLRMQRLPASEIAARMREALERVNMAGFASRRVTDLSGGEQQRVALARALAPRPRLLMFDEPLGALDRALKEQVEEELRQLLHETGIPAIYVTHDQEEAFAIADRLILLHNGRVVQRGTPAEIYEQPANPWVAQFMGLSNLLPGKVVSRLPLQAQTAEGLMQGTPAAEKDLRPGQPVTLLLRPRAAVVQPHPVGTAGAPSPALMDHQTNQLHGQVTDCVFRGDGYRLQVKTDHGLLLFFYVDQDYPAGQTLELKIATEAVQFFVEEE